MKQGILRKKGDWYQIEYKKGPNTKRVDLPGTFTDINSEWVDKEVLYETNPNGLVIKIEYNGQSSEAVMSVPKASNVRIHIDNPKNIEVKEKETKKDHIGRKTNDFARAPYNFVPVNDEVFFEGETTPFDKYEAGRKSGYINVLVSNLTPLFLRQISEKEENFGYGGEYGIPGSSFRGMIRTMCEILSYSKMSFYNKGYIYFRGSLITMDKIHAGMIAYDEKEKNYKIYKCKYDVGNSDRWQQEEISPPKNEHGRITFTTGKLGTKGYNKFEFFDVSTEHSYVITLEDGVYLDYLNDKTAKKNPNIFDKKRRGQYPVFYQLNKDDTIKSIGTAKFHRIPYSKAVVHHLPAAHKKDKIDICEALFGIIKNNNDVNISSKIQFGDLLTEKCKPDKDFLLKILASPKPTTYQHYLEQNDSKNIYDWDSDKNIRGNKLYWHRKTKSSFIEENQNFDNLLIKYRKDFTYDVTWNEPWGKAKDSYKYQNKTELKTKSHTTRIKPIMEGASFKGKIWFQNLSDLELGLLITALEPGFEVKDKENVAHKIGLGKPLGLGSITIKVDDVQIFDTSKTGYFSAYEKKSESIIKENLRNTFLTTLAEKLRIPVDKIWDNERLKELKTMLTWNENEVGSDAWLKKTRYMEITRGGKTGKAGNEYEGRPILPRPTQYKSEPESKFVDKSSTKP
jgi:CRISPR-associated protein (TIGR03986 family)